MNELIRRAPLLLVCFLGSLATPIGTTAQDQTKKESPAKKDAAKTLTEGLLDLLEVPEPPNGQSKDGKPDLTPADVGLADEDLGEQSSDPLRAVRQSMVIAAAYLERGLTNAATQELQTDIVERLDDLIEDFEQAQQKSQRRQSQSKSEAGQSSAMRQQQQTATAESQDDNEEQEVTGGESTPGQFGAAAEPVLKLKDSAALQQSVWGQLPERVRKQMQSQMVEQFLPSYRDQIEAYFRALMEVR